MIGNAQSAKSAVPSSNVMTTRGSAGAAGILSTSRASASETTRPDALRAAICSSKRTGSRSTSSEVPPPTRWYRRMTTPRVGRLARSASEQATLNDFRSRVLDATGSGNESSRRRDGVFRRVQRPRSSRVETQQHVERGQDEGSLANEQTKVRKGLEAHRIEKCQRPRIEQKRRAAYSAQRERDGGPAVDNENCQRDALERRENLERRARLERERTQQHGHRPF